MSATIELNEEQYIIDDYVWLGPIKTVVDMFNSFLDPEGPSGSDPNPDLTAAQNIVERFGGKIIDFNKLEFVPNRVY